MVASEFWRRAWASDSRLASQNGACGGLTTVLLSALPPAILASAARKALGQPFLGADKRFQLVWPLLELATLEQVL